MTPGTKVGGYEILARIVNGYVARSIVATRRVSSSVDVLSVIGKLKRLASFRPDTYPITRFIVH
jgi:hypothetical protein